MLSGRKNVCLGVNGNHGWGISLAVCMQLLAQFLPVETLSRFYCTQHNPAHGHFIWIIVLRSFFDPLSFILQLF